LREITLAMLAASGFRGNEVTASAFAYKKALKYKNRNKLTMSAAPPLTTDLM